MRQAVRAVARLFPTAIITGRGRDKVLSFVQLRELFYAGSHGLDIVGPQVCMTGSPGAGRIVQLDKLPALCGRLCLDKCGVRLQV